MPAVKALIVRACTRDGAGGSPTTVVLDSPELSDRQLQRLALQAETSHTVFVLRTEAGSLGVRFFTRERELVACGHGTIAAHAAIGRLGTHWQTSGGRRFPVTTARGPTTELEVSFELGPIDLAPPPRPALASIMDALGMGADDRAPALPAAIASPGTPRLLLPATLPALERIEPQFERLAMASRAAGLLGCFVYAKLDEQRYRGRMFAPAAGIDEDIANGNSSGCLAALLLATSSAAAEIHVDQGDALGTPSTMIARARPGPEKMEAVLAGRGAVEAAVELHTD